MDRELPIGRVEGGAILRRSRLIGLNPDARLVVENSAGGEAVRAERGIGGAREGYRKLLVLVGLRVVGQRDVKALRRVERAERELPPEELI